MASTSTTSPLLLLLLAAVAVAMLVVAPVSSADLPSGFASITSKIPNPWSAFQNLTGCHFGDQQQGLAKVKDYLSHFGYLPSPSSSGLKFNDIFDADLEEAIRLYQRNFGLDVTGAMDAPTVAQMMAPRCGVADIINGTSTMGAHAHGRNLFSYFPGSPAWPRSKKSLTYAIARTAATPPIDRATLSLVFARAFARWSAATTLNFTEAASARAADITIGFYAGDHGDGEAFDGPLGTLAHAFSPTDGRFHLDAAEAWVATGDVSRASSAAAVDLESVAVHEIGHLLGLGHSGEPSAIMYPTITSRTRKVDLAQDDVAGIQNLYGGNPNFKGVAPPATSSRDMDSGAGASSRPWSALVGAVAVAAGLAVVAL